MKWLLWRELKLAWHRRTDTLVALGFYLIAMTLFPLGLGAEAAHGERVAAGAAWISLLLAVMLVMPDMYRRDAEDGTLEQWRAMGLALEQAVLAKLCAMLLSVLLPLLAVVPVTAAMLGIPAAKLPQAAAALAVGMLALFGIGSAGAALLAAGNRRGSFLFMLLVLPVTVPALIFGSAATWSDAPFSGGFPLLLSFSCAALPLGVWLSAALLRQVEL